MNHKQKSCSVGRPLNTKYDSMFTRAIFLLRDCHLGTCVKLTGVSRTNLSETWTNILGRGPKVYLRRRVTIRISVRIRVGVLSTQKVPCGNARRSFCVFRYFSG